MNLINSFFRRSTIPKIIPLQKKGDIQHEVQVQTASIRKAGYEILGVFSQAFNTIILYRQWNEDVSRHEEMGISLKLRIIHKKGLLHPEPMLNAFYNKAITEIKISDIDIKKHMANDGYGSILLSKLIHIAKEQKIHTITGWISKVDQDHLERLVHFYEKHGFEVLLHNQENSISIGSLIWQNKLIE